MPASGRSPDGHAGAGADEGQYVHGRGRANPDPDIDVGRMERGADARRKTTAQGHADEVSPRQGMKIDRPFDPGEWVGLGHGQHARRRAQPFEREVPVQQRRAGRAELSIAGDHRVLHAIGIFDLDRQPGCIRAVPGIGEKAEGKRRHRRYPDRRLGFADHLAGALPEIHEAGQRPLDIIAQHHALLRQHQPLADALEQRLAEVALQLLDHAADRRLGHAQMLRRRRDAAERGDLQIGLEDLEAAHLTRLCGRGRRGCASAGWPSRTGPWTG